MASLAVFGCSTQTERVAVPKTDAPAVEMLEIGGIYDVALVKGEKAILVDTGPEGAFDDLSAAIRGAGVEPRSLALVILTHAHSDHAGNARAFQKLGVPILVHEGDAAWLRAGNHGELFATNLEAVLAQPGIPSRYPAVEPDIVVVGEEPFRLEPWGVSGTVIHAGGHTPGSVVVHLANGVVILGDLVRGGWFAGLVDREAPATHLFHQYPVEESTKVAEGFVRRIAGCSDVRVALVGHGGPISIDALRGWAGTAETAGCPW
jgi:glyoxylase-like metal-dependent hydrolase (beta-lactamase superfamily II)